MSMSAAQVEADRLHRSGSMMLLSLAAFWGIAAALYTWGTPLAGQIALLIGTAAACPVAWLVLKLAGGPAMLPRSNPLKGLSFQVSAIPLIGVLAAMALAQTQELGGDKDSAFFAASMLGLAAAFLPMVTLYGRPVYLALTAVFLLLPVIGWVAARPLLPWFGLIGVLVLLVAGALFLRSLGGLAASAPASQDLPDDASVTDATRSASHADASTDRTAADRTATEATDDAAVITDADVARDSSAAHNNTTHTNAPRTSPRTTPGTAAPGTPAPGTQAPGTQGNADAPTRPSGVGHRDPNAPFDQFPDQTPRER